MNRAETIAALVAKTGLTKKDTEATLKAFEEVVTETLVKGEKVSLTGFVTLETATQAPREVRNPKDPSQGTWMTEERQVPKAKFGKTIKDAVAGK